MSNQMVLRGGCALTPPGHARATLPQLLPAGLALGAVRGAARRRRGPDGRGGPVTGAREPDVAVAARPRLGLRRPRRRRPPRPRLASRAPSRPSGSTTTRGSELFDEITRLPEYYPTERRARDPRDHADGHRRGERRDDPRRARVSGTSDKTRTAARRVHRRPGSLEPVRRRWTCPSRPCATRPAMLSRALPGRCGSRPSSATSPSTWATCPEAGAGSSPSSAAPSATSTSRSGAAFLGRPARQPRARRLVPARHRPRQEHRPAASRPTTTPRASRPRSSTNCSARAQPRARRRLRHRRVLLRPLLGPAHRSAWTSGCGPTCRSG